MTDEGKARCAHALQDRMNSPLAQVTGGMRSRASQSEIQARVYSVI